MKAEVWVSIVIDMGIWTVWHTWVWIFGGCVVCIVVYGVGVLLPVGGEVWG